MNKSKGLLFLAYYFPPIRSIAIWRNYFLATEAKILFDNVYVFTTSNYKLFDSEKLDISLFDITKLNTFDYRYLFKFSKSQSISYQEYQKQGPFSKLGIKILNSFPVSFIIGEGGMIYIINGYKNAKRLIKAGKISHVYSSYRPLADHWIAYLLKRKYPELHWTADFRDLPFDSVYRHYLWKRLQIKILNILLNKADLISTFSKGIQKGLEDYTGMQVHIIPNGIFHLKFENANLILQDKFTIQYTGSLFLQERDPSILFKAVSELIETGQINPDSFRIQYAGKDGSQWKQIIEKYKLSAISSLINEVSTAQARILQRKAHINLLLTSSLPGFTGIFTGKFYEYLGSGRPMLVIINGIKDEEFEAVFNTYHLGKLCYNNPETVIELKSFIIKRYDSWKQTGRSEWDLDKAINEDFSWKKSVEIWKNLIRVK